MKQHAHFIDTVDDALSNAVKNGIFQLSVKASTPLDGRSIEVKGKKVVNFGSCSYLALEVDARLKQAAIEAIHQYGVHLSSSRAYLSCGIYEELEDALCKIFGGHSILGPSTTLTHLAAIPVLVRDEDVIILDQQVHGSVQNAVQVVKARGVHVEMIRHNRLDLLEDKIKECRSKFKKIWYMADGVFSMYGDYTPIHELYKMLNTYEQLHLYFDDAHGMSWAGKHGRGYVLSQVDMHPRIIHVTSLGKGFGVAGGAITCYNYEDSRKIKTCGSSFVFSGPLQPPILGAMMASARIHLSDEIYSLQNDVTERVAHADALLRERQLPYVYNSGSPIIYIAVGLPRTGYNMIKRLLNEGYYADLGIFPGVPVNRTGLRLTITRGVTKDDITGIIDAIDRHFPSVLQEENQSIDDLARYFKVDFPKPEKYNVKRNKPEQLIMQHEHTIQKIDKETWDELLGGNGSFDWDGCAFLEEVFSENPEPENNWAFHYFIVKDKQTGKPVLATFFTEQLLKDDMLAPASVSLQIEAQRKEDPSYLISRVIMMGSMLTEGSHLYLDRTNPSWQKAMEWLLEEVKIVQRECGVTDLYMRDFDEGDEELNEFFHRHGFFKVQMPDAHVLEKKHNNVQTHIESLDRKKRYHIAKEMQQYEEYFDVKTFVGNSTDERINQWKQLYRNVKEKSYELNTFYLPERIFDIMRQSNKWLIVELSLKQNPDTPVVVGFVYSSGKSFVPMILGMDYNYNSEYKIYRQCLYQVLKLAFDSPSNIIYFGMLATEEKRKLGFKAVRKNVYLQTNDTYKFDILNLKSKTYESV